MTNVDVIHELYRTFRERDYDAFAALCTPDIEWIQNEGFPGGATRRGADAIVEGVFKAFGGEWEAFGFETGQVLDAGDSVVVLGVYAGTHRATGRAFRADAAHVYDLEDGKVARFRQYTDTAVIRAAMG